MKLLTLFVRYGDADYEGAFKRLCQMYQRVGGLEYDALLIDTALSPGVHAKLGSRTLLMGGGQHASGVQRLGYSPRVSRTRPRQL